MRVLINNNNQDSPNIVIQQHIAVLPPILSPADE